MSEQSNRYVADMQHDARHEGYDEGYLQGKLAACQDCTRMGLLTSPPRFVTVRIPGQYTEGVVLHIALDKITEVEVTLDRKGAPLTVNIGNVGGGWRQVDDPEAMRVILAAIDMEVTA
jgi:hypothetical protein